jgi:leucyl aminopeptidase (aminopeptidase T)
MNKGGSQKATVTMTHAVHSCDITELTFEDGRVVYFSGGTNVFSDMALIAEPL